MLHERSIWRPACETLRIACLLLQDPDYPFLRTVLGLSCGATGRGKILEFMCSSRPSSYRLGSAENCVLVLNRPVAFD